MSLTKGFFVDSGLHVVTSGCNLAKNLVSPPSIVPDVLDCLHSKYIGTLLKISSAAGKSQQLLQIKGEPT